MKCVSALVLVLCVGLCAADTFNYLLAAYNHAVAIKHNFDDAYGYYGEYFTQELELISGRITDRLTEAVEGTGRDEERGRAISECAATATFSVEFLLLDIHLQFAVLDWEATQLHLAVYEKMSAINVMETPFDELYFKFTEHMFSVYTHLNDVTLPNLQAEITELIEQSEVIQANLEICLWEIK